MELKYFKNSQILSKLDAKNISPQSPTHQKYKKTAIIKRKSKIKDLKTCIPILSLASSILTLKPYNKM
jgi:hypothetical protein